MKKYAHTSTQKVTNRTFNEIHFIKLIFSSCSNCRTACWGAIVKSEAAGRVFYLLLIHSSKLDTLFSVLNKKRSWKIIIPWIGRRWGTIVGYISKIDGINSSWCKGVIANDFVVCLCIYFPYPLSSTWNRSMAYTYR